MCFGKWSYTLWCCFPPARPTLNLCLLQNGWSNDAAGLSVLWNCYRFDCEICIHVWLTRHCEPGQTLSVWNIIQWWMRKIMWKSYDKDGGILPSSARMEAEKWLDCMSSLISLPQISLCKLRPQWSVLKQNMNLWKILWQCFIYFIYLNMVKMLRIFWQSHIY